MWNIYSMLLHQKKGKCLQLVVRRRRRGRGVVEVVLVYTSCEAEQRTRTWVCYIHTVPKAVVHARTVRHEFERGKGCDTIELHDLVVIMSITQLWLMEFCHPQSHCHRGNISLEKQSWNSNFIIGYTRCSRSGVSFTFLYTVATPSKPNFRTDEL